MTSTSRRRGLLALGAHLVLGAHLAALAGCAGRAPPPPPPRPLPPLATGDLAALLPAAGLAWLVRSRPRAIAQVPWLIPAIAGLAPEARLDRFASTMGFDLRQTPEAWFARHDLPPGGSSDLLLVRHNVARPEELERRFTVRLAGEVVRAEDRPDLVRVSGRIGPAHHGFARIGGDVAAYQEGGAPARGPLRVVSARAAGGLREVRPVAAFEPVAALLARFGEAPLVAIVPGPFDDGAGVAVPGSDAARLLAASTGAGAALRPTAREGLGLAVALCGDFGEGARGASRVLDAAWEELAASEVGRILALDRPRDPPLVTHTAEAVALAVELEPGPALEGLRALIEQDLEALLGPG